jgi:bacillithiol biosynthesis cysteine-adding enzyme BshC
MPRSLGAAWLAGAPEAAPFLALPPASSDIDPPVGRPEPRPWLSQLDASHHPGAERLTEDAWCVVTGQQVGLFGGPLFTLYKAWTAVAWARALGDRWQRPVVPVFWVQEEDHDLEEIAWCGVPRRGESPAALRLDVRPGRTSVADQPLPPAVAELGRRAKEELRAPFAAELGEALSRAYRPGRSWADAFVDLMTWVFEGQGLVFFRPRTARVAAAAAGIHRRCLFEHDALTEGLRARAERLQQAGFQVQVAVRDHSLCFVHLDRPRGPRVRLAAANGGFVDSTGASVPLDRLRRWLDEEPLRFSTSALLRPVVQDHLLPTVAYVAGPGEAAYWGQLAPLYDAFGRPMPRVLPRARFRIVEPWMDRLLARHRCEPADAAAGEEGLLQRMPPEVDPAPIHHAVEQHRRHGLDPLRRPAADLGLDGPLGALERAWARSLERFEAKADRIVRRRGEDRRAAARRLTAGLFPEGQPQERFYGLFAYVAEYGRAGLLAALDRTWAPGTVEVRDVRP